MNKLTILAALAAALLVCVTIGLSQAVAADEAPAASEAAAEQAAAAEAKIAAKHTGFSIYMGDTFAAGLIIIGAAYGIGRIGSCAVESMARQPEVAGSIQTAMIIAAALIEGVTFFGLIICLLAVIM